jgi:hypothetical protein
LPPPRPEKVSETLSAFYDRAAGRGAFLKEGRRLFIFVKQILACCRVELVKNCKSKTSVKKDQGIDRYLIFCVKYL